MTDWLQNFAEIFPNTVGLLQPTKVLVAFDGPRLFVAVDPQGGMLLVHQIDEDFESSLFLVAPFSDTLLNDLEQSRLTLRSAFDQSGTFVVEIGRGWEILKLWDVRFSDIPNDMLPEQGVTLTGELEMDEVVAHSGERPA